MFFANYIASLFFVQLLSGTKGFVLIKFNLKPLSFEMTNVGQSFYNFLKKRNLAVTCHITELRSYLSIFTSQPAGRQFQNVFFFEIVYQMENAEFPLIRVDDHGLVYFTKRYWHFCVLSLSLYIFYVHTSLMVPHLPDHSHDCITAVVLVDLSRGNALPQ